MIISPEKIEQTLEQKRAQVAILDGEVVNLKKAKLAEQVTIQHLLKEKSELESQNKTLSILSKKLINDKTTKEVEFNETIQKLTNELSILEAEVESLQKKKENLQIDIEKLDVEGGKMQAENTEIAEEITAKKEKVDILKKAIDEATKALDI